MILISILLLLIASATTLQAQSTLEITNFSSDGETEWVEVQNVGDIQVDLTGWGIGDSNAYPDSTINLDGCIDPGKFRTFTHNSGWLNNSGDTIFLYQSTQQIDQLTYSDSESKDLPISDSRNDSCVLSTPIPTEITPAEASPTEITPTEVPPTPAPPTDPPPTSTLTPTKTPSPTKTPTPTRTPTPSPSTSPWPTATPYVTPDLSLDEAISDYLPTPTTTGSVLGIAEIITPKPTPAPPSRVTPSSVSRALPYIFIGLGCSLLIIPTIITYFHHRG